MFCSVDGWGSLPAWRFRGFLLQDHWLIHIVYFYYHYYFISAIKLLLSQPVSLLTSILPNFSSFSGVAAGE